MLKGQPPNFKASVWNFPIPTTGSKCNSIFRHAENWTEIKGRITLGQVHFEPVCNSSGTEV